jgi:hypothetical protein
MEKSDKPRQSKNHSEDWEWLANGMVGKSSKNNDEITVQAKTTVVADWVGIAEALRSGRFRTKADVREKIKNGDFRFKLGSFYSREGKVYFEPYGQSITPEEPSSRKSPTSEKSIPKSETLIVNVYLKKRERVSNKVLGRDDLVDSIPFDRLSISDSNPSNGGRAPSRGGAGEVTFQPRTVKLIYIENSNLQAPSTGSPVPNQTAQAARTRGTVTSSSSSEVGLIERGRGQGGGAGLRNGRGRSASPEFGDVRECDRDREERGYPNGYRAVRSYASTRLSR